MIEPSPTAANCRGIRADGEPCGSVIVGETGLCFAHDPDREVQRAEARARGGSNSSNVRRLRRHVAGSALRDVFDRLDTALGQCHVGALAPARAHGMAALARAMIATLEVAELEERLEALESRLLA